MKKKELINHLELLKSFSEHYTKDSLITKEKLNKYMNAHIDELIKTIKSKNL